MQPGQVARELVGLPGRGAVADRDQIDAVLGREAGQYGDRLVPAPPRFVRVDRFGGHDLTGRVDDRDLDTRAQARIETHGHPGAGGRGEQEIAQVDGEHPHRGVLGRLPQTHPQVDVEVDEDAGAPGPAHGVHQPAVGRAAQVGDGEALGDGQLVGTRRGGLPRCGLLDGLLRLQGEVEDLLLLTAEQREDPVRGQLGERLGEVEVVGELGAGILLALAYPGGEPAPRPHPLAQGPDQVGILGEPLDQDRACAVQRGADVVDAALGVDERCRGQLRVEGRIVQQRLRQRFQARLPGDLRLGTPFGLVRQVDVLEARLRVGGHDLRLECVVQLALRADGLEDRGAALLQLTQVPQPLLKGAQLRVVEHAGRFLAVAGDERHGGPAVEQVHGRGHLALTHAELLGDPAMNRRRHNLDPPSRWGPKSS